MDSYLSGDSRNIRRPNVSSWVIWGAVKKSGSEILIKEEKWQLIDPHVSISWALSVNHYFYSLPLWGFRILSHTTQISRVKRGARQLNRNSMWGIVQLLNSKIKTILEKDGRRIWRGGGLWTRWQSPVDDYLVSPSLFHWWDCQTIRLDNLTFLYFTKGTFQASQWQVSVQDGTSWSSL